MLMGKILVRAGQVVGDGRGEPVENLELGQMISSSTASRRWCLGTIFRSNGLPRRRQRQMSASFAAECRGGCAGVGGSGRGDSRYRKGLVRTGARAGANGPVRYPRTVVALGWWADL
jgi:hypothetical protein